MKKTCIANEIAEALRNSDIWDMEFARELCELADMNAEFDAADGDSFESIVFAAAETLGVEII